MKQFVDLHQEWGQLRIEKQCSQKANAPNHNLIRFLTPRYGIARSETGMHTPFLRDLLNPFGTHGQGTLFLRGFISMLAARERCQCCQCPHRTIDFDPKTIPDFPEPDDWIVGPHGSIDIAVFGRSAGVLLFIENKIDHKEEDDQLKRYRQQLDSEEKDYKHKFLVFLAPRNWVHGIRDTHCPKSGSPDFHITYEDHILKWLRDLNSDDLPQKVRANLQQYCEVIAMLSNREPIMENLELIKLLAKWENFRCAAEIGNSIDSVRDYLGRTFWNGVHESLKSACGQIDGWRVTDTGVFNDDRREEDKGIYVSRECNGLYLMLGVARKSRGEPPFCGVGFSRGARDALKLPEIAALRDALKSTAQVGWDFGDTGGWWIGSFYTNWTNHDDFCFRIAHDLDGEVRRLTDPIERMLNTHLALLNSIDDKLMANPIP